MDSQQFNFFTSCYERTFLIDCDRVSRRERDREIHLDQDDRTRLGLLRDERNERRGMTGGRCATRIVRRTHVHAREAAARRITSCRFAESTPGSTGVDLKLAVPDMAPPPSPYMATLRAYTRLLRRRERYRERVGKKRGEKKGNNNNRSLPGTS